MQKINIQRCSSENKDFRELIRLLDTELDTRYGTLQKEYNQYNQIEYLETVVVAYDEEKSVGCGCFKKLDDQSVEMKRVFVQSDYRGKGFASAILEELERWAKEKGFLYSILETGVKQHEAISLYQKKGYVITDNFGQYVGNQNSICMKKAL
ncbi:GNAT family N-acetyltransferase [uncultured Bacteroides sp.]|uniref:GNAT family N-acetyltransferase n=1 Tax=uncultured Bacteroides sp. TaxID=162156 RepID=UPI002AAB2943|nr:GNAT family N-acetyltransferase [uncultured Bacteroides sp.]